MISIFIASLLFTVVPFVVLCISTLMSVAYPPRLVPIPNKSQRQNQL